MLFKLFLTFLNSNLMVLDLTPLSGHLVLQLLDVLHNLVKGTLCLIGKLLNLSPLPHHGFL